MAENINVVDTNIDEAEVDSQYWNYKSLIETFFMFPRKGQSVGLSFIRLVIHNIFDKFIILEEDIMAQIRTIYGTAPDDQKEEFDTIIELINTVLLLNGVEIDTGKVDFPKTVINTFILLVDEVNDMLDSLERGFFKLNGNKVSNYKLVNDINVTSDTLVEYMKGVQNNSIRLDEFIMDVTDIFDISLNNKFKTYLSRVVTINGIMINEVDGDEEE